MPCNKALPEAQRPTQLLTLARADAAALPTAPELRDTLDVADLLRNCMAVLVPLVPALALALALASSALPSSANSYQNSSYKLSTGAPFAQA